MLIDEKQHEQNIAELAEELLEFYIQALTDKKMPALSHKTVNQVILFIHDRVKSPITVEELRRNSILVQAICPVSSGNIQASR